MALIICAIVFVLGVDTAFFLGPRMRASATEAATVAITQAQAAQAQAETDLKPSAWFTQTYRTSWQASQREVAALLSNDGQNGANDLLEKAKNETDLTKAISLANDSKAKADEATTKAKAIGESVKAALAKRQEARTALASLETAVADQSNGPDKWLKAANDDWKADAGDFLTAYTDLTKASLDDAHTKRNQIDQHVNKAEGALPDDGSTEGVGDPQMAADEINIAKALVDQINTLSKLVTAELEQLKSEREQTPTQIGSADTKLGQAQAHIDDMVARRGYSKSLALGQAQAWHDNGVENLKAARLTASALVLFHRRCTVPSRYGYPTVTEHIQ